MINSRAATEVSAAPAAGIAALFEAHAARSPAAPAVRFGDEIVTYGDLNRRANQLARRLRAGGVAAGAVVAVCLERTPRLVEALLAILKAGATYLPLDPAFPAERLSLILADARAAVVIAEAAVRAKLPAGVTVLSPESATQERVENLPPPSGAEPAAAYVIYTSGSTGRPKGVVVPQSAVMRLVVGADYVPLASDDVMAQAANAAFDAATFEIWGPLLNGGSLAIIPPETVLSPRQLMEAVERHGITTLFLTTALFNQVAREIPAGFRPLRHLLFGGEACDPRLVATVLRAGAPGRLLHVYGPTETTTFALWHEVKSVPPGAVTVPIGKPIAGTTLHLEAGELCLGGCGLARGYLNQPELTAEKFVTLPNGTRVYRTGDLVRVNDEGDVEFLGRADFQVKIRGFRIELGEVEAALAAHPEVREVAVLAREDVLGEKRLVGYASGRATAAQLREFLRMKLPAFMVPTAIVVLDKLPLNANGKIDRAALPLPRDEAELVAPAAELETDLLRMWQEALRIERIGVEHNFFDLGGSSLQLAQVHGRIEELLGRKIPITALFQFPTIRALAAHLQTGAEKKPANPFLERARRQRAALSAR